tara:strand:+ start:3300 stop:4892 length:1593 start_codon:yes stop_codon:yes gene_type:complete
MGVKVTNNGFGTLSAGINSTATTVTVDSGQGARFPTLGSGDFFFATLIDTSNNLEIIKVTARSTDSMTVLRAQDNTTARSFSIGDRIELRPTAALFENAHLDNTPTSTGSFGLPKGTTAQRPTASATEGHIRYNTDNNLVYYSDGTSWLKISATPVVLSSVSGDIINGIATNLTLAGTGFLSTGLVVSFTPSGGSASTVTVTPTSDTAATVAVPSAIYGQSASTVISIFVTNNDSMVSTSTNKTVVAAPSGGTVTTSGGERIHVFNTSGTFVNTVALTNVAYLIVAGGGGGGVANGGGGGGGAGGYRNSFGSETSGRNSSTESKVSSLAAGSYTITVGGGGAGNVHGGGSGSVGVQGSNSSFNSIVSIGGGFGAGDDSRVGGGGGSGGGNARTTQSSVGAGTSGQGFDGGNAGSNAGGGGGGAGAAGTNGTGGTIGGNGGNGLSSSITGSAVTRAGGGGGGAESPNNNNGGVGGTGGGGKGGQAGSVGSTPTTGDPNSGGGGGASGDYNTGGSHNGQNGGSGVVIIRYAL